MIIEKHDKDSVRIVYQYHDLMFDFGALVLIATWSLLKHWSAIDGFFIFIEARLGWVAFTAFRILRGKP